MSPDITVHYGIRARVELLRYLCILVIIDKIYRQMIDILHSTACVIALYKIIEAALLSWFFATKSLPFSSMGALFGSKVLNL